MKIGAGWCRINDKGDSYISIKIDEAALPLTIGEDKRISLWENPKDENANENTPDYILQLSKYVPKKDKEDKQ